MRLWRNLLEDLRIRNEAWNSCSFIRIRFSKRSAPLPDVI